MKEISSSPGEEISELIRGTQGRINRGEIGPEEANLRVNLIIRQLNILYAAGIITKEHLPFETGSTQVEEFFNVGFRNRKIA